MSVGKQQTLSRGERMTVGRPSRRILLTGATGFIGSHLAKLLVREGQTVFAIIRPGSDRWRLHDVLDKLTVLELDLTDTLALAEQLRMVQPELCMHLAWRGWSGASAAEDNISSLSISLELIRTISRLGCRRFIVAGTCFEYDMLHDPLSERTPLRPHDLYGTCKSSLLQVGEQFSRLSGMQIVWPRIFYSYGPYEDERRLVPSVVLALLRGEPAHTTAGAQVRDYLHAEDIASAIWTVACSEFVGAVNVASGTPATVNEVIRDIGDLLGKPDLLRLGTLPYRSGEPMVIRADTTILREQLGWSPQFELRSGLLHTIEWWKARLHSCVRP